MASNRIDSLKNELKNTKNDTSKINILFEIGRSFESESSDSAIASFNSALIYISKLNTTNTAIEKYKTVKYFDTKFKLIQNYIDAGKYDIANSTLKEVQAFRQKSNDKRGMALCYSEFGILRMNEGKYPDALIYNFKALKLFEVLKDTFNMLRQNGNIGIIYDEQGLFDKALLYYNKALAYAIKTNNKQKIATQYGNIGIVYSKQDNFTKSIEYYNKALLIEKESNNKEGVARNLMNIANDYDFQKKYKQALPIFFEVLKMANEIGNKSMVLICNANIALAYNHLKNNDLALKYISEALSEVKTIKDLDLETEFERIYSEILTDKGKHAEALIHFKNYINLKDSVFNRDNTLKGLEAEAKYDYEKKEAIAKVENMNKLSILKAENALKVRTRNFIIVLVLLSLLATIFGFIYYFNRKALLQKQLFSQQLITSQEAERSRIAKDLHDGVGQNILFIKNQLVKLEINTLINQVDDAIEEVRNISKDLYPNQLERYGLVAAVDAMVEKAKAGTSVFVSHDLEALNVPLTDVQKINVFRIIQETLSNTLKHAKAKALRITATLNNGVVELIIQDDGMGYDKSSLALKSQKSFGLLGIEERVKILNGKFNVDSNIGTGTKSTFIIPV